MPNSNTCIFHSEAELVSWAKRLASLLCPGDVIALSGDLGVGKSVVARSVIRALGVTDEALPSPTYALIQEYQGRDCRVAHMDLYRLESVEEVIALGVRDFFQPPWICLVEWAERMQGLLPESALRVQLSYLPDSPEHRLLSLSGVTAEKYAATLPRD